MRFRQHVSGNVKPRVQLSDQGKTIGKLC
ncbi:hypothetical protein BVIET440_60256 [Burkholderia vietnamiensis]